MQAPPVPPVDYEVAELVIFVSGDTVRIFSLHALAMHALLQISLHQLLCALVKQSLACLSGVVICKLPWLMFDHT